MATYKLNKQTGKIEKKQDDHPAYVKTFLPSLPWRILNGRNRKPSPKTYSNSSHGAGPGARGSSLLPGALTYVPNPSYISFFSNSFPKPEPPPAPTIPYAGIRTGEIIGERFWWIKHQGLTSITLDYVWGLGCTVEGDTNKIVYQDYSYITGEYKILYGGIYSFHTAYKEIVSVEVNFMDYIYKCRKDFVHNSHFLLGLARGRIKMWGDVVEHEKGYRAQFAKLISIDKFTPNPHDLMCKEWCQRIVNAHREAINALSSPLPRT